MDQLHAAMEAFFDSTIRPKIDAKLEGYQKKIEAEQSADVVDEQALEKVRASYRATLETQTLAGWLASQLEGNISRFALTTHPPTFSDPSSKSVAIDACDQAVADPAPFVTSSSAARLEADTLCGSAALPLTSFLKVSAAGRRVIDAVQDDDWRVLAPFAASEHQAGQWVRKIAKAQNESRAIDPGLSQVFFPVGDGAYHLLVPLFPSSLYNHLHQRLVEVRFGEANTQRRRNLRAGVGGEPVRSIPDTAALAPIGSQPQNVSQFNAARRGLVHLFSAAPPQAPEGITPPLQGRDAFWRMFSRIGGGNRRTGYLARFLKARHWQNNRELRGHRDEVVSELVSDLIQFAAQIQTLEGWEGWSRNSDIPRFEQLWLDPGRSALDEGFRAERERMDWLNDLRDAFSGYLNRRLKGVDEYFEELGKPEAAHWGTIFEQFIRESVE